MCGRVAMRTFGFAFTGLSWTLRTATNRLRLRSSAEVGDGIGATASPTL